jgi:hypothetical protein
MSVDLTGTVNFVDTDEFGAVVNPFGITTSSTVSGVASWNGTPDGFGVLSIFSDPTMTLSVSITGDTEVFSYDSATDPFLLDLTYGFAGGLLQAISLQLGTGSNGWGLDVAWDELAASNVFVLSDPSTFTTAATGVIGVAQAAVPEPAVSFLVAATALGLLIPALRRRA